MNILDHVPDDGFGIGMDVSTGTVFFSFNGQVVPLSEDKLDELVAALMYMMQIQEVKKTAGYN